MWAHSYSVGLPPSPNVGSYFILILYTPFPNRLRHYIQHTFCCINNPISQLLNEPMTIYGGNGLGHLNMLSAHQKTSLRITYESGARGNNYTWWLGCCKLQNIKMNEVFRQLKITRFYTGAEKYKHLRWRISPTSYAAHFSPTLHISLLRCIFLSYAAHFSPTLPDFSPTAGGIPSYAVARILFFINFFIYNRFCYFL